MDEWERFNETSLPNKESFYSNLDMEDIKDFDCNHAKRVYKDFEIKNLGEYYDLYLESDALLLTNGFEYFRKYIEKCMNWINMTSSIQENKVELKLLADTDMLLRVEKVNRGGKCHSIYRYAKVNNKYIEIYDTNKEF